MTTPTNFSIGAYMWRCIILPGSINVSGSAWVAKWGDASGPNDDGQRHVVFTGITSLEPGQYQAREHFMFNAQTPGGTSGRGTPRFECWEVEGGVYFAFDVRSRS